MMDTLVDAQEAAAYLRGVFKHRVVVEEHFGDSDTSIGAPVDILAIGAFDAWEPAGVDSMGGKARKFHRSKHPHGAVLKRQEARHSIDRSRKSVNSWCSFAAALLRRDNGLGCGRRGRRLYRAKTRCDRELRLGKFDDPSLMPRSERWLRSPFMEERHEDSRRQRVDVQMEAEVRQVRAGCLPVKRLSLLLKGSRCSSKTASVEPTADDILPDFGMDFWRLPLATLLDDRLDVNSSRWEALITTLLDVHVIKSVSVHRRRFVRRALAPMADIRRWSHLHNLGSGRTMERHLVKSLSEHTPPLELTLAYQSAHAATLQQARRETWVQRRWCRFLVSMYALNCQKVRQNALCESKVHRTIGGSNDNNFGCIVCGCVSEVDALGDRVCWCDACQAQGCRLDSDWRGADSDWSRGDSWSRHYAANNWSTSPAAAFRSTARESEEAAASQLGIDLATYRMLKQLEQREISPEDYDLLGRLDESVKRATLLLGELKRFPIKMYRASVEPRCDGILTDFGMDFWRVPFEALPDDTLKEHIVDRRHCDCLGFDFWKLPLVLNDDADESTADGASSYEASNACGVCLLDFDIGDELRCLPCGHIFHRECIDHWLLNSSTVCPIDKRDVRE